MTAIDVVGGVYAERCAFPIWDQIFGSAGRAAVALTSSGDEVRLHTLVPRAQLAAVASNIEQFGVVLSARDSEQFIGFDYLHSLSDPAISPRPKLIRPQAPLEVDADRIVQFGMIEAHTKTNSEMCVYDPQSARSPTGFQATGSKTRRLAIVTNAAEARSLTGQTDLSAAGSRLLTDEAAEIVIIKDGLRGARLFEPRKPELLVPAYKTNHVFTIGSGDVFVAAFASEWFSGRLSSHEAVDYASRATASYVETSALPLISGSTAAAEDRQPVTLKGGQIYLAGPFRDVGQRFLINDARSILTSLGMSVFSPVHDIGQGPAEEVVKEDLAAVDRCDALFAILNAGTSGTAFEVGYAVAKQKPVYAVAQNVPRSNLKLPIGSGCSVYFDYVTALHQIAWRA